jgi:hypothetical protein
MSQQAAWVHDERRRRLDFRVRCLLKRRHAVMQFIDIRRDDSALVIQSVCAVE